MPILHDVSEDLATVHKGAQVPRGTGMPLLEEPEGQVKVRAMEGPVEDLALIDFRQEWIALREADIVLEELAFPFQTLELDADPNRGSG